MLDRHSEIAVTPETAFYDEIVPNLRPGDGAHLRQLLGGWTRPAELGLNVDRVVRHCGPDPSPLHLLGGMLELYARDRGKAHCGEKTPQHLRHVPRILADFPNARVLCLLRDGRDVVLSLRSMPWRPENWSAVDAWLDAVRLSELFAAQYPACFLVVRYEDLVAQPEKTLVSVMDFLGLPFEAGGLVPGPPDVVLRRSLEWKGLALGPIDRNLAQHRRRSAGDLDLLNDVLGPVLKRLGYS